jgi:hypothetical protein
MSANFISGASNTHGAPHAPTRHAPRTVNPARHQLIPSNASSARAGSHSAFGMAPRSDHISPDASTLEKPFRTCPHNLKQKFLIPNLESHISTDSYLPGRNGGETRYRIGSLLCVCFLLGIHLCDAQTCQIEDNANYKVIQFLHLLQYVKCEQVPLCLRGLGLAEIHAVVGEASVLHLVN